MVNRLQALFASHRPEPTASSQAPGSGSSRDRSVPKHTSNPIGSRSKRFKEDDFESFMQPRRRLANFIAHVLPCVSNTAEAELSPEAVAAVSKTFDMHGGLTKIAELAAVEASKPQAGKSANLKIELASDLHSTRLLLTASQAAAHKGVTSLARPAVFIKRKTSHEEPAASEAAGTARTGLFRSNSIESIRSEASFDSFSDLATPEAFSPEISPEPRKNLNFKEALIKLIRRLPHLKNRSVGSEPSEPGRLFVPVFGQQSAGAESKPSSVAAVAVEPSASRTEFAGAKDSDFNKTRTFANQTPGDRAEAYPMPLAQAGSGARKTAPPRSPSFEAELESWADQQGVETPADSPRISLDGFTQPPLLATVSAQGRQTLASGGRLFRALSELTELTQNLGSPVTTSDASGPPSPTSLSTSSPTSVSPGSASLRRHVTGGFEDDIWSRLSKISTGNSSNESPVLASQPGTHQRMSVPVFQNGKHVLVAPDSPDGIRALAVNHAV
jgi:hypothetical protein